MERWFQKMKFNKDLDYMMNATRKDYCCMDLMRCGWIELDFSEKKVVLATDSGDGTYSSFGSESKSGVKFCPFCGETIEK